jgi:lipopolysaccharide cholinephosphotransferase
MISIIKKILPEPVKNVCKKIRDVIFKNKIEIKRLNKEIDSLKLQIEFFKHHFDITQVKPATGYLREFQLKELAFTQEIIKMLESYGIKPFLNGGALLGACRHKGFIPWDDDIDLSVTRDEFNQLIEIAKKNFVWIDSTKKNCYSAKFYDMSIQAHPDKFVFILTPYCLHLFKGTNLKNSLNLEFFPNDYVREDVTEEQYLAYRQKICDFVQSKHTWKEKFEFYERELKNNDIYSKEPTSRMTPGIGNWDLTEFKFRGFWKTSSLYPLKGIAFENAILPSPQDPISVLEISYGKNWMQFPDDVGIPHTLEEQNIYYEAIGEPMDFSGF